eukprot:gene47458-23114_t
MGFSVHAGETVGTAQLQYQQCCPTPIVNFEVWRYGNKLQLLGASDRIRNAALGYEGMSALYAADVDCGDLTVNRSLGCVAGNYVCERTAR